MQANLLDKMVVNELIERRKSMGRTIGDDGNGNIMANQRYSLFIKLPETNQTDSQQPRKRKRVYAISLVYIR